MKRLWHDFDLGSRTEQVSRGLHVCLFDTVHFLISQLAGLGCGRPRPCIIDTVLSRTAYRGWDSKPENENSNLWWPHWWTDFAQKADLLSWSETNSHDGGKREDGLISRQFALCPSSNVHIPSDSEIPKLHHFPHLRQENWTPYWHGQSGCQMLTEKPSMYENSALVLCG